MKIKQLSIVKKISTAKRNTLEHVGILKAKIYGLFGKGEYRFPYMSDERLLAIVKSGRPVKLHLGCGARILAGWINMDMHYQSYQNYLQYYTDQHYRPEIRGNRSDFYPIDVTKRPLPLPNNSVDVVFHEDFLEHINQRDQVVFLAEVLRVLKPGGIHRINTPNLIASMRDHSDFSKGFSGVYVEEWNGHGHYSLMTPQSLTELATMVGYSKVICNAKNKSTSPMVPSEYRPDPHDRPEDGNVFADLIK